MYIDMIESKVRLVTSRYIQLLQVYPISLRAPEEYSLHEFCLVIILFVIGLSKSPSLPILSSFFCLYVYFDFLFIRCFKFNTVFRTSQQLCNHCLNRCQVFCNFSFTIHITIHITTCKKILLIKKNVKKLQRAV